MHLTMKMIHAHESNILTHVIVSFDVFTKENTLGGYVIGATDTMHAITDEHFCRQLDDFAV